MLEQILIFMRALLEQTGAPHLSVGNLVMIVIGGLMIYLAVAKHHEPLLRVDIGFSCIVAIVPGPPEVAGGHAILAQV